MENPNVPLSSPNIVEYAFGKQATEAGTTVDTAAALRLAAVFACMRVRAESLAALPWGVFERRGNSRVQVESHPLAELLRDMVKRESLQMHVDGWGNGYLEIIERRGSIDSLALLAPNLTRADRGRSGDVFYLYQEPPNSTPRAIPARRMVHVAGPGFDGLSGYPILAMHAESIGYGIAARNAGARLMRNDGRPRGYIQVPHRLQPGAGAGIREEFEAQQIGENFGRIAVLAAGSEYKAVGLSPDQLQYVEQMDLSLLEICRLFLVPPHRIGFLRDAGDRANIEQENLRFATDVQVPAARRMELAVDATCLSLAERERGMFTKIDLRGNLRGDYATRMAGYAIARQWGLYNVDEIRALEDDPPIGGRAGETYLQPMNMQDAAEDPPATPPATPPGSTPAGPIPRRALRPIIEDAARRIAARYAERPRDVAELARRSAQAFAPVYATTGEASPSAAWWSEWWASREASQSAEQLAAELVRLIGDRA